LQPAGTRPVPPAAILPAAQIARGGGTHLKGGDQAMSDLERLKAAIIDFRNARDWAQFHDPKNLAAALSIEAAELQELFLWQPAAESHRPDDAGRQRAAEEAADIFIFLTYLCDALNIDLAAAVTAKIAANDRKYPVEKARGSRKKYTEL
jgi:dCTP diphosphatase